MAILSTITYSALISGTITTLMFLFLTFAVPGFRIKNNITRIMLTVGYFFMIVIIHCLISPVTMLVSFLPWVGTMINMVAGFVLTLLASIFVLQQARKNDVIKLGIAKTSNSATYVTSTLLGAASAASYLALPLLKSIM